jgi:hypothetical protein
MILIRAYESFMNCFAIPSSAIKSADAAAAGGATV